MGENPVGQLMAANGTLLVTDLFASPQAMVVRFGARIRLHEKEFKFSQQYNDGIAHARSGKPYAPVRTHGKQAVLEYGTGYLRGLLPEKAIPTSVPAPKPVAPPPPPAPVELEEEEVSPSLPTKINLRPDPLPVAESPPKRKRGRPRKVQ